MKKNLCKILALVIFLSVVISAAGCSASEPAKKIYKNYAATIAELAEKSPVKLKLPSAAPEGTVMTEMYVLTQNTAVAVYDNGSFKLMIAVTKSSDRPKEMYYSADREYVKKEIAGYKINMAKLTESDPPIYYAETKINGVNYYIDCVTESQLETVLSTLTDASAISDEKTARGLTETKYDDAAAMYASLSLTAVIPAELPEGFTVASYYSAGDRIAVTELTNGTTTLLYIESKGNEGDCFNTNAYKDGVYTYTDQNYGVDYTISDGADAESAADDVFYFAKWSGMGFEKYTCYFSAPEGLDGETFVKFYSYFYNESMAQLPVE